MFLEFKDFYLDPIHDKYAWRICDFCAINEERLKRFFPKTLEENLTPDLSKYFVERKIKAFEAKEEFLFVLKGKANHSIIGLIYLKELDWQKKQGELAYAISYQAEGKGYMTETINALSDWALKKLQLKTLQIITHKSNIGSVRVAEKCGYIWKGILSAEHTPPGELPLDMELYELNYEG